MHLRLATALALGSGLLLAQAIPARPEQLTFPPVVFKTPMAKDLKAKLKNGIPAYLAPNGAEGAPLVRLTVSWRGGAYLDPKGKEGLAALFGSQLVQGGSATREPAKVEDRLESLAATLSASCGETSGQITLQVLARDLDAGLELLLESLTRPAFAQDRLDLARRQARQALSRRNDAVTSIASYQFNGLLFGPDHFASAEPTAASLDSLTREDLLAFQARLLHPGNLVVAVSGAFERKAMLDKLNRTLGALKPGQEARLSPKVPVPAFPRTPGIYVTDKDAPQAMVTWALPGLRRSDPQWHAAYVMNQLLGGPGFTSRLMKTIRSDEGLTYGVYSALGAGAHWRGDLVGRMQTKNRSVAYALRLALAEMARLKAAPASEAELRVIKDGITESFPTQWPSKQAIAGRFAEEALQGWPEDWWVDFREKIQAVTVADVQRMAKQYLALDQLVILVVGKASEVKPGDTDHPGTLQEVAPLPFTELPLRDPQTGKALR
jgi:predicted Zn-dependent peptidase